MTIALVINVNEGAVIASDSASTQVAVDETGNVMGITNVYNNANKIFNPYKGLPIGVVTYGLGSIGPYSIALLAKEFREQLLDKNHGINPNSYTIEDVANRLKTFIFDDHYETQLADVPATQRSDLGFIVSGYTHGERLPETYVVETSAGAVQAPVQIFSPGRIGLVPKGMPEAIYRLTGGFSTAVLERLISELQADEQTASGLCSVMTEAGFSGLISAAMPLQDAIDLARFLVEVTEGYQRFLPGAKTVGGPIEIGTKSWPRNFGPLAK